jgi:hypothetical protein
MTPTLEQFAEHYRLGAAAEDAAEVAIGKNAMETR